MKNSFIIYNEHKEIIDQLSDEQAGQLFKAIFEYEEKGTMPDLGALLNIAATPIRQSLDRNKDKYEEKCKQNSINGAKGGRPKKADGLKENRTVILETEENPKKQTVISESEKSERLFEKPKKADSDSDNDSDNDNDSNNLYIVGSDEADGKKPKTKATPVSRVVFEIYNHWNSKNIVVHRSLTSAMEKGIKAAIKKRTPERVKALIDRYAQVVKDESHFFDYQWTLENFLKQKNGIDSFDDEGDKWINYLNDKRNQQEKEDPFASTQALPRGDDPFQSPLHDAFIDLAESERMRL